MESAREPDQKSAEAEGNNNHGESLSFPITKGFLEVAFDKTIEKFTVNPGTNPGDNYLSTIYAVEVSFFGDLEDVQHYFIKCNPEGRGRRDYVEKLKVFEKELFFYQKFLPNLHQVAKDTGADVVDMSVAPFLGGNHGGSPSEKWKGTEWANETFLIMTDIRHAQFVMKDRQKGLDMEHATVVIKEMAKWHALTWAYKQRNGWTRLSEKYPNLVDRTYSIEGMSGKFDSFFNHVNGEVLKVAEESLGKDHPVSVAFKKVMDSDVVSIIRTFLEWDRVNDEKYNGMLPTRHKCDDEHNKEPWLTGTHGDCWLNNMLFRYDAIGKPTQVILVDLQNFREARPTMEIAHFLYSSVRAPVRIPGKDELLRAYFDTFNNSCKELDVQPYPGFCLESLKRRFRRSELFGLLVSLPIVAYSLKTMDQEVTRTGEGKNKDLKAVEGMDKNIKFKEEVLETLVDLYENGVI